MIFAAGLIILKGNKILLIKPQGLGEGEYSIPKGGVMLNESYQEAAIRETFEEIGVLFSKADLGEKQYVVPYLRNGEIFKKVFCYVAKVDDRFPDVLPVSMLQATEVEDARFYNHKDALTLIHWRFRHFVLNINDLRND